MHLQPDQVAVVTGGASGIGLALARAFGAQGMKLMLGDIEEQRLATVASGLRVDGFEVETYVVDVSSEDAVDRFADATFSAYGAVHVLCNNAGVVARHDSWGPLEDWKWVLGVDLWGVVHGVHSFVPRMLEAGHPGHVVNTASVAGILGFPWHRFLHRRKTCGGWAVDLHASRVRCNFAGCLGALPRTGCDQHREQRTKSPGIDPEVADADNPSYALTGEALHPDAVADEVVTAISSDRFWILPQSHYVDQGIAVAQSRVTGEPPPPPQVRF